MTGRRVLVVDDDELARRTLLSILRRAGYMARAVGLAAEAELAVAEWQPDTVVLDRQLGTDDGIELGSRLREARAGVRLVLLSGEASSLAPAGFDAVLLKPAAPREVLAAVAG